MYKIRTVFCAPPKFNKELSLKRYQTNQPHCSRRCTATMGKIYNNRYIRIILQNVRTVILFFFLDTAHNFGTNFTRVLKYLIYYYTHVFRNILHAIGNRHRMYLPAIFRCRLGTYYIFNIM